LLSGHYDTGFYFFFYFIIFTVSLSPGAYDDTSAVGVLIQVVNDLANDHRKANDLYVLINNAEEMGLIGAYDFANNDPEFKKFVFYYFIINSFKIILRNN